MSALRVASRYAKSLLQHAIAQNRVDNIQQDMLLLDKVCNSNCAFLLMLKSPVISGDKKLKILKQIRHLRLVSLCSGLKGLAVDIVPTILILYHKK